MRIENYDVDHAAISWFETVDPVGPDGQDPLEQVRGRALRPRPRPPHVGQSASRHARKKFAYSPGIRWCRRGHPHFPTAASLPVPGSDGSPSHRWHRESCPGFPLGTSLSRNWRKRSVSKREPAPLRGKPPPLAQRQPPVRGRWAPRRTAPRLRHRQVPDAATVITVMASVLVRITP